MKLSINKIKTYAVLALVKVTYFMPKQKEYVRGHKYIQWPKDEKRHIKSVSNGIYYTKICSK